MVMCLFASAFAAEPTPEPHSFESSDDDVEEIVVTASRTEMSRREAVVPVDIIDAEAIEASGAESLAELLEEQSGLQIQRTVVGTQLTMRGLNPQHTLVLIDGQRLTGSKDGVIDLYRLSVDDIERIEIVKGASSALYGSDAMGGVVHIITKSPEKGLRGGVHARGGSLGRGDLRVDLSGGGEKVQHRESIGLHHANPWDLDPSDEATTASGYDQLDVDHALRIQPSDDHRLDLTLSWMRRDLAGVDATAAGAVIDRIQRVDDARASLRGSWLASEDVSIQARASTANYRDQLLQDQRGSTTLDTVEDSNEWLSEAGVQVDRTGEAHTLTVGAEGLHQSLSTPRLSVDSANRVRGSLFAQDSWQRELKAGPTVQVATSARIDVDSRFGQAFTPRLATQLRARTVTFRLAGGGGYRAPDFREQYLLFENPGVGYIVQGNPELKPERSWGVDASAVWFPRDGIELSVALYGSKVNDLINFSAPDVFDGTQHYTYRNVDEALTSGSEVQLDAHFDRFDLGLGYTYTRAQDLVNDTPLEGRTPHRVTASADVNLPLDIDLHTHAGWSSPQTTPDATVDSELVPESVFTVDLRASRGWEKIKVFGGVDNLFNQSANTFTPLMPRFFYAGIDLTLSRSDEEAP